MKSSIQTWVASDAYVAFLGALSLLCAVVLVTAWAVLAWWVLRRVRSAGQAEELPTPADWDYGDGVTR